MHIDLTPSQQALRKELRSYFEELVPPETQRLIREEKGVGPVSRELVRRVGRDGWLGLGWPVEYGGRGMGTVEQLIFFDEAQRVDAPVPVLSINSIAPSIMEFGTDEQKARFLPPILAGESTFAIGYTEPEAGTDLASLSTRAVRDGDSYVVNGQKVFTSNAVMADYIWLAVRTDPTRPRSSGISILIVPVDAPGVRVQPLRLMGGHNTNQTFYDAVRVPAENLVGTENDGWRIILHALNYERVTICLSGFLERALEETLDWASRTRVADGSRLVDVPWVRTHLARVSAGLEFKRLSGWQIASTADRSGVNVVDASVDKVFGSEFYVEAFRLLLQIVGEAGYLADGAPGAVVDGQLEYMYRTWLILTFGGGTNEIQRDLLASIALGMPAGKR